MKTTDSEILSPAQGFWRDRPVRLAYQGPGPIGSFLVGTSGRASSSPGRGPFLPALLNTPSRRGGARS